MEQKNLHKLGIDIGSTTVKITILGPHNTLLFADYQRHFANIRETLLDLLARAQDELGNLRLSPVITGSGGLALAKHLKSHLCRKSSRWPLLCRIMRPRPT